jgi:sulfur-oxidizing protein SoxY
VAALHHVATPNVSHDHQTRERPCDRCHSRDSLAVIRASIALEHCDLLILLEQELIALAGPEDVKINGPRHSMLIAVHDGDMRTRAFRTSTAQERTTMTEPISIPMLDRRELLLGASAAGAVAGFLAVTDAALGQSRAAEANWEEAIKKVLGDAKPVDGKLLLELPEIAENGNTVPFAVSVDSPMTDQDYVRAVHVFSTGNPQPAIATFHFTSASGKASVASRMRLAKTQDVVGIAELSDGRFIMAKRTVKVTIGGCGG